MQSGNKAKHLTENALSTEATNRADRIFFDELLTWADRRCLNFSEKRTCDANKSTFKMPAIQVFEEIDNGIFRKLS
jgi:hypothetical protein